MTGPFKAWSFSSLQVFEKCPYQAKLKYVDKIPEPQNKFSERGTAIHNAAEAFVRGEVPTLIPELATFTGELHRLRELYAEGRVIVEQDWAHTASWDITDWRAEDAWLRLKLDFLVLVDDETGMVIDLKSGRKSGNEVKHAEQGQLYTGCTFSRYPKLKRIITEFWYSDQNDISQVVYTPQQAARFLASFDKRGRKMTDAREFPPKPSIFNCKWCPYRPVDAGGDGNCEVGVGNITPPKAFFKR